MNAPDIIGIWEHLKILQATSSENGFVQIYKTFGCARFANHSIECFFSSGIKIRWIPAPAADAMKP